MSATLDSTFLASPSAAVALTDSEWMERHVPRYEKVLGAYTSYSEFLEKVLVKAKHRLAPLAFVEVRAKSVPSFAEKILRKRQDYQTPDSPLPPDPLVRLTDLCGGRVITQTAAEVKLICRLIEEAFDVDWPNSEDVSQRLKAAEFGYRSVHYIVQVNKEKLRKAGIEVDIFDDAMGFDADKLGPLAGGIPLKAEIQVRTLLEHAAASLGHDTLYKTEIQVPARIKRQHATLSAMLEEVDSGFGQMLVSLKELQSNYGAHFSREVLQSEIGRLRLVLEHEPDKVSLSVRIAGLALACGQYETAIDLLRPYQHENKFGVQRRLGQALTEMYWDHPKSAEFLEGRALLEKACKHPPQDSETLSILADCVARDNDYDAARDLFHRAIQADASEPVTLSRYLEFEIAHLGNDYAVRLSAPMIAAAMTRCQRQIEGRVNLPAAWSSLAVFSLLVGKPYEALDAISHLTTLCEDTDAAASATGKNPGVPVRPSAAGRALLRLRDAFTRLHGAKAQLSGFDWCERAILLALAARVADADAIHAVKGAASWGQRTPLFTAADKIVILAGGCSAEIQKFVDELKPQLLSACEGLSFKLLGGGTPDGVSALAGDVAETSGGKIEAIGYVPQQRRWGVREENIPGRYKHRIHTAGADFSPLEPLQGWTDLMAAGIKPSDVKLLAYAGKTIARSECAMALALGAKVGVIENANLPKERLFLDPEWQSDPNLIRLPMDAMTIRAFIQIDSHLISAEDKIRLEGAARLTHEDYVKSATPKELSLAPWPNLAESLKLSNYLQVAYWEKVFREYGLGIRKLTPEDLKSDPLDLLQVVGEDEMKKLAELEHGRWNVERLSLGWRYAKTKDVAKKLSPCLVPWDKLKDIDGTNYQPYDFDAVRGLPEKLRRAGSELYKL